ncbi:MAG: uncharacterized protein KVP18_002973 [Porospora cf. gigantea A]|uniref:uncharacterized protein n=1 Tax=Porospora cf. gigantea A TaxID=2853593 RepID=UPI00355A9AD3|nr:MAG: hypothetical protein KVP18_002973 [Porospora cf. gigantea A]
MLLLITTTLSVAHFWSQEYTTPLLLVPNAICWMTFLASPNVSLKALSQQTRVLTAILYLAFLGMIGSSIFLMTLISQAAGQQWAELSRLWLTLSSLSVLDVVSAVSQSGW